jgi:DUF4097 and DUF4098 domain-containing protein YvlB
MLRRITQFVSTIAILSSLALAQQGRVFTEGGRWVQEIKGDLGNARVLRIDIESGSVEIQGSSQSNVTYEIHNRLDASSESSARKMFEGYQIDAKLRGDTAVINAQWDGRQPHRFSGDFRIMVPRDLSHIKIETSGGDIGVRNVGARLEAESAGGSLRLSDIGGTIDAHTGGGSIDLQNAGAEVNLETGGGSIHIASAKGRVNAQSGGGSVTLISGEQDAVLETGGGSIRVDHCGGRVHASTGGGSIDLGDIGGSAEMDTGGGNITLASAKGPVRATTGGGSIMLNGVTSVRAETSGGGIIAHMMAPVDNAGSTLETSAGDITVYVPVSLKVNVQAEIEVANGHRIHTDFPELKINSEGGDWGPSTISAEGAINGGGPVLRIQTTTGDIYIRRTP